MLNLLDTQVTVPGSVFGSGTIMYIGPIRGKTGIFAGIELDSAIAESRGRNSGDVEGVYYFEVSSPGSGLFLPWDRLRTVNPHLPITLRSRARSDGTHDYVGTPSPKSQGIGSRGASSIGTDERTALGRDSPLRAPPKLQVPKLRFSSKDLSRPTASPRAVSMGLSVSRLDQSQVISSLRKELDDAKLLLHSKNNALAEKGIILDDLRATINELNPLIREYESAIAEKDRKVQKQKSEYETAREEWRQSLNVMLNAQQETELLYELEIADLKEEIAKLVARRASDGSGGPSLVELENMVRHLQSENKSQRAKLATLENGATSGATTFLDQISMLESELEKTMQELASTQSDLSSAGAEIDSNRSVIEELRLQSRALGSDKLLQQFDSLSLEEWHEKEAELQLQIKKLQSELSERDAAIAELRLSLEDLEKAHKEILTELATRNPQGGQTQNVSVMSGAQTLRIKKLELDSLKNALSAKAELAALKEARALIDDLKHQLEMRPSFEELTGLQKSMDEVDALHQRELQQKDDSIAMLQLDCDALSRELQSKKLELRDGGLGLENGKPGEATDAVFNPLKVHIPARATDASEGRENWCGFCEREGHGSLECPYENDMF
ncbi:hypothetical protein METBISCDRAFT_24048 [Metschnikowia bicuspidata]|uniref:CAP-Gly domain-containing protein n=1 Tax=Metschnikowia bicuspidata TaxID=27322 RepID=A0A4P9ZC29_9ASCO|nr:hypothetical protein METBISCDRAFT_24048 [Metschnikowia bicuspidata]